ncbi:MAG: hypothetical protein ACRD82_04825, partial [Blastocatellia bacterium]
MREKLQKDSMICPCCGEIRGIAAMGCDACGARQIGEPMVQPDVLLPKLGISFAALGCAILIVLTFLFVWILSNDMKVGRVLMVWALGDATELTRELLKNNSSLATYRIFSYDAYKVASMLAFGLVPFSLFGIWLSRRAMHRAKTAPVQFGGYSLARFSSAASVALMVIFASTLAVSVPE